MKHPTPETTLVDMATYHIRKRQCAQRDHRRAVKSLNAFAGHELTCGELSARLIDRWAAEVLPAYAPSTAKLLLASLLALWRHAAEWNAAPKPPAKRLGIPDYREGVSTRVRQGDDMMTVWTLFESLYLPAKLSGNSAKIHSTYRAAVKWLCYSLGRPASLADLTPDVFRAFFRFCASRGLAPATVENHRARLVTLSRFAFDRGIIAERPLVPHVDPSDDGRTKPSPWNEAGTLAHFYASTFKPEVLQGMRAATVAYYDAAVRAYLRYAGSNVDPASISQRSIAEFAAWLRSAGGYSAFVIDNYPSIVTRIWRHHSPEAAPPIPLPVRHGLVWAS